jgi:SCP-2 sterol transfer family
VHVATKRQVETKLRQLIKRLDRADQGVRGSLAESLPDTRIIEVVIPDLGTSYWTELAAGRMDGLHEGSPREAEIRVRVSSDHLIDLVDGEKSLFAAYLAGQVSIDASFSDLLRLRKLA